MEYLIVWVAFAVCCIIILIPLGKSMMRNRARNKERMEQVAEEKDLFSHLTSEVFDNTETIDLTRAVIYHIQSKEDRLYEDEDYDGNLLPHLSHDEKLVYTLFQLESSISSGRGTLHDFFTVEPYCDYRPYYKEAFENLGLYEIAHLLEEAEKLANMIENDEEDDVDEESEYGTYNFADFTNELIALLRSTSVGEKLGEYIREHKESFIEKGE